MRTNHIKNFLIVSLFACFLFTLNTSAQTEQQSKNPNIDSAVPEEVTEKLPQTDLIQLSPAELSRIRIPNIQQSNNPGEGRVVYLSESFEAPFTGDPAAPPGWTQSRVVLLGDGIPEPNGADGEKDWQQNIWTGSAWTLPGFTSGIKPTGAVSGAGVLYMEDSYFGSTTSGGFGSRRVETPSVNLTASTSPYVRFRYFYNRASDFLNVRVMASSNGGATWNPIMILPANADVTTMTAATPWQRINVIVPPAYRTANAKFGIEMTNTWGTNDIFIDDFIIEDFTPTTITSAQTGNWNDVATWVGGIIPTSDNHVVIAAGHTVSVNINIARCQNLTLDGTINYATTSTTQLLHIFGNLTVNATGVHNSFNGTTGKRTYLGGSLINNGTINFSVGAGNLVWVGGTPATYSGTGSISSFISNLWHINSGGVTYNNPVEVRNTLGLYEGLVNPNGNLTVGNTIVTTQTVERISRGGLVSEPIYTPGITRSVSYITANITTPTKVAYSPSHEIPLVSGVRTLNGTLAMNTYDNLQLNTPVEVGTTTTGGLTLSRGIIITSDANLLTLNSFIAGPAGTAPSTAAIPTTHGSYVVGPMRINFPATGTTTRNFALGVGTGFNGSTPNSNVLKTVALSSTSAWTGSTVKASIVGAPSGTVNSPLTNLMGPRAYRLDLLGGTDLPATTTVTIRGRNSTFGNSDNMFGDISEIRVAQSPSLTGPWTNRSNASGSGAILNNTDYARTTSVAAPGPISPLVTNGEYFALATTASVINPSDVSATAVSPTQINVAFTPNIFSNNVVIVFNNTGTFEVPAGTPPAPGNSFAGGTLIYNGLTSPFNHTGLTPSTTYFYRLFSYDGAEYSPGVSVSAATQCDVVTSFSQNFDAVTTPALPVCWTKVGTGGTVNTQTASNFSPPNCLYIFSSSTTSIAMVSMPPVSNAGAGTHQLRFKARANFTVGGVIQIGYLTNPTDPASFVKIDSIITNSLTYQDYTVLLGTAPGSNQILAFRHTGNPANSSLIDDVVWEPIPACPAPTSLTATGITANSAILGWTETGSASSWDVEYGVVPFTPTGTPTNVGVSNPFNLIGLSASTNYAYYVRSNCGSGSYSTWSGPFNFTTACDVVSTFPWGPQGFEGTFPPNCWTRFTGLLENPSTLTSTTSGWLQDEWQNVVGSPNKAAKLNIWSTTVRHWLMTPQINLGGGAINYQLEFDLTLNAFGTSNPPGTSGVDDKFAVVISTDGGTTWSSANVLRLWDNAGSPYVYNNINHLGESVIINLTGYTGVVMFGFYGESTVANADNDLMIDNVQIRQIPVAPIFSISPTSKDYGSVLVGNTSVQNFTISNTGGGVLTINSGGITLTGANSDQFSLGTITYPINLNAGENVVVQVTFAPTSTGIKNANLQVVHSAPGSPGIAALTGRALPAGILYEQFSGTTFPPDGWLALNRDGGTQNWGRDASKFNSAPASASSRYESTTLRNDDWLITPRLSVVTGDELSFFISSGSTSFTEELVVKIGTTNDPNGSWTNLDSILTNNTAWVQKTYDLSAYNGQNVYIAFVNRGFDKLRVYIDDVVGPLIFLPANDLGVTAFAVDDGLMDESTVEVTSTTGLSRDYSEKLKGSDELKNLSVSIKLSDKSGNTEAAPMNFEVTVRNFGSAVQNSYQVGWMINGVVQSSVSNTSPIAPGATQVLQLTWASPTGGLHTAKAWTILAGDENPNNDTSATISFYVIGSNVVFGEYFETTYPWGWLTVNADGGGITGPWFQGNPTVFTALEGSGYAGANFNGANGFYIDEWLISPNTGGRSSGEDTLSFWVQSPVSIYLDSLEIRVSTTGTDLADFTLVLAYIQVPKGQWTQFKYVLPNAANRYIAFRYLMYTGGPSGAHSDYIGLDAVEIISGSSSATFPLSVSVSNGWNMVSIPGLHPLDQNVNTWWSGKDPGAGVFRFAGGYQAVTTVAPGTGYWMKHLGANTYNTGDEWPAGGIQIVPNDPIPGVTGWNLIGGYQNTVATAGLTTTPGGLISGQVFGYTPGSGYAPATNLTPGYAYWIKLTGAGQINIPSSLAKGSPTADYIKSDWGRIILTDASGKSYTLYSVNGEIDLTQYELPPLPPAGMFDVRYGSQRLAEVIGSEIQTIEMQGIEYPVTVRVEGMTIRLQDETGKIVNQVLKSGEDVVISNPQVGKLKVSSNVIPETYSLEQNYPNPFNPSTTIEFSIPEDVENVKLTIYDALGQKIAELVNGKLEAGRYSYQWDASKLASGLYIYQLQTSKFTSTKKMLMLK